MKNISYYFGLLLLFSCAGFRDVDNKNAVLNKNNLGLLDGIYSNASISHAGGYVGNLTDVVDRNTRMFAFKDKYNGKDMKLQLKIINQKKLNVKIYDAGNLLADKDLRVKLESDGFLYLKEKRFMLEGIPLVLGGLNIQKSRFTVDTKNNLQVQTNYFFCNGFMIVMSDWKTLHYHLDFEKTH